MSSGEHISLPRTILERTLHGVNMLEYITFLFFLLLIYLFLIVVFILLLHKVGISKQIVILTGFALFGILAGIIITLHAGNESNYFENFPAVFLSDWLYSFWLEHYAIHYSGFGFTVPWVLRWPQRYFITSVILWSFLGLLAQLLYNSLKKTPLLLRNKATIIVLTSLVVCSLTVTGFIYFSQSEELRASRPSKPVAYGEDLISLEEGGRVSRITSFWVTGISVSSKVVKPMEQFTVEGTVKNWGLKEGIGVVVLDIDNKEVSGTGAILAPGESKTVRFFVLIPEPGIYKIEISNRYDSLSENVEVSGN